MKKTFTNNGKEYEIRNLISDDWEFYIDENERKFSQVHVSSKKLKISMFLTSSASQFLKKHFLLQDNKMKVRKKSSRVQSEFFEIISLKEEKNMVLTGFGFMTESELLFTQEKESAAKKSFLGVRDLSIGEVYATLDKSIQYQYLGKFAYEVGYFKSNRFILSEKKEAHYMRKIVKNNTEAFLVKFTKSLGLLHVNLNFDTSSIKRKLIEDKNWLQNYSYNSRIDSQNLNHFSRLNEEPIKELSGFEIIECNNKYFIETRTFDDSDSEYQINNILLNRKNPKIRRYHIFIYREILDTVSFLKELKCDDFKVSNYVSDDTTVFITGDIKEKIYGIEIN
ncbi:MAG TPA: hypothetical protein EYG89_06045 [Bacteroidia bacterium]|nr:hypothetical protein [Bacteroidia bacterium]